MKGKIENYYKLIRQQGISAVKNPLILLLSPFILFFYFKKRWRTATDTIYLVETPLFDLNIKKYKLEEATSIIEINDIEKALPLINKRVENIDKLISYKQEIIKRFERGDTMHVLIKDNTPLSYLFTSIYLAELEQVHHKIKIKQGCFSIYDVYTFEEYRRLGLYELLLGHVVDTMSKLNFTHSILWLMKHNQSSVKVHNKLGFTNIVGIYKEHYRFGVRFFHHRNVNIHLSQLIEK